MKQSLAKMFLATAEVCENFPVRVLPIIHWNHRESV
jgi:hypothetical protein